MHSPSNSGKMLTALPFEQAITVNPLVLNLKELAIEQLNNKISAVLPEATNIAIQSIDFAYKRNAILFELSKDGKSLLESGKAVLSFDKSGKLLPHIKNSETGKIIEQFRGAKFPLTSKLASLSSIIIGAAHIVSAADISRRMERIQEGVSFLVAARKIDQMAELKSLYEHIRELFTSEKSSETLKELKDEVRHLSKLRYTWLGEIEYHLNQLSFKDSYESKSWLQKLFASKTKMDESIVDKLTPFAAELQLIDFTIVLELLIYEYCENSHLAEVRLIDEISSIGKIKLLLKEKSELLSSEDINVNSLLLGFDDLIQKSECFVPSFKPETNIDPEEIRLLAKSQGIGRNQLCPCGSFKKHKNCCLNA